MNEIKSKPHVLDILPIDDRQYMITENVSSDGHIRIRVSGTVLNNRIIDSHCIHVHLIQTSWPLNFFWILIQFPFKDQHFLTLLCIRLVSYVQLQYLMFMKISLHWSSG
jgi:hypothetical protein